MADKPGSGEEIKIKLDGKPVTMDQVPPELRPQVEARIQEARESLESKYPKGKLRMNINVKWKTSKAALAKSGAPAPKPAVTVVDDGGFPVPWPILLVLTAVVFGGLYLFVPDFAAAVDKAMAALPHK